jgi:hypothetical protein
VKTTRKKEKTKREGKTEAKKTKTKKFSSETR